MTAATRPSTSSMALLDGRQVQHGHVAVAPHHVPLGHGAGGGVRRAGQHHPRLRGGVQHLRGEDGEEVGLQPLPVHLADGGDAGGDAHPLHVPGDHVAHVHLQVLRHGDVQRHLRQPVAPGPALPRRPHPPPQQRLRLHQRVAVGGAVLAPHGPPLRRVAVSRRAVALRAPVRLLALAARRRRPRRPGWSGARREAGNAVDGGDAHGDDGRLLQHARAAPRQDAGDARPPGPPARRRAAGCPGCSASTRRGRSRLLCIR